MSMNADLFLFDGREDKRAPFQIIVLEACTHVSIADRDNSRIGAFMDALQIIAFRDALTKHIEENGLVTAASTADPRDTEEQAFDRASEAAPLSYAEQGL